MIWSQSRRRQFLSLCGSLHRAEDVVVVGAVVSGGLESVTTVPFKNEIFRVDVDVSVTVLSEVFAAEEL